jgi:hypothetical protein
MKYYLSVVLFALVMGGLGVLLKPHPVPVPGIAMMGLFGVQHEAWQGQQDEPGLPLTRRSRAGGNPC